MLINLFSNAIGPLIGLWILITTGEIASKVSTPLWILVYGGIGITVGLWIWGRRVIETIGQDLATITPSRYSSCCAFSTIPYLKRRSVDISFYGRKVAKVI